MTAISIATASCETGLRASRIRELLDAGELFGLRVGGEVCLSRSALPMLREIARKAAPAGHERPVLRFQIGRRTA